MQAIAETHDPATGRVPVRIVREPQLAGLVLCVGGQAGNGKTMLTPILSSFARVEMQKYNYTIEHLGSLHALGRLDDDVAAAMIRMQTDLDLYNMTMGRETNFRFGDVSSVFQNPGKLRYLWRILQPGDEAAVARIRATNPILHFTLHFALTLSRPMFLALGDRLRVVELVRHPLYMIKQQFLYAGRHGTDPRDFTIWFNWEDDALPFFARGWEDTFRRLNPMDRIIYAIRHLTQLNQRVIEELTPAERQQVMFLPFEPFVREPWPFLRQLEALLGTRMTPLTQRELRRQRVPRRMIAAGMARPIYRLCGWEPPAKGATERDELNKRRRMVAEHASREGLALLDELCEAYEARYWSGVQ